MKDIIIVLVLAVLVVGCSKKGILMTPTAQAKSDSLRVFVDGNMRNSAVHAFSNMRLHRTLIGYIERKNELDDED